MKRRPLIVLIVLIVLIASCSSSSLAFRADDRVEILHPPARAEVELPVQLQWRIELDRGTRRPRFAVFIDRAPVRPGQQLRELVGDSCVDHERCPYRERLAEQHIFVTEETRLTLDAIPARERAEGMISRRRHTATIVFIDRDWRRIGESAFTIEFTVKER